MLAVSSIRIAVTLLTQVGSGGAGQYEVDMFNDCTDDQFRRHGEARDVLAIAQDHVQACPQLFWSTRTFEPPPSPARGKACDQKGSHSGLASASALSRSSGG